MYGGSALCAGIGNVIDSDDCEGAWRSFKKEILIRSAEEATLSWPLFKAIVASIASYVWTAVAVLCHCVRCKYKGFFLELCPGEQVMSRREQKMRVFEDIMLNRPKQNGSWGETIPRR
jgi:hypothetical protein